MNSPTCSAGSAISSSARAVWALRYFSDDCQLPCAGRTGLSSDGTLQNRARSISAARQQGGGMLRPCPAALPDVLADVNGDHACSSNVSRENDMDDAAAPPEAFESSKMARTLNRMKDQNRAAQQRYRERQKEKLLQTQQKVEQLTAEINKVKLQKESLAARNALLEKYMAMQELQAREGRDSVVEAATAAWWLMGPSTTSFVKEALQIDGVMSFAPRVGQKPVFMTCEEVAALPDADFNHLWQDYPRALAALLDEAANNGSTAESQQRMLELIAEAGRLRGSIAVYHPNRLNAVKRTERSSHASTRLDVCQRLLDAVRFTPEQAQTVLQWRRLYLRHLGAIVRKREPLTHLLQELEPMSEAWTQGQTHFQSLEAIDRLRDSLREEHGLMLQYILAIWRKMLTPVQAARLVAHMDSEAGEMASAVNVLAEQHGEPSPQTLMAATGPASELRLPGALFLEFSNTTKP